MACTITNSPFQSFSTLQDASLLAKQKARVLIDSILEAHDRRTALVGSYQTAIATYKTSKDSKTFKTTKKSLDDRYKSSGEEVSSLVKELQGLDSEAIAKVRVHVSWSLGRLDVQLKLYM